MSRLQWKKGRTIALILGLIFIYFLIRLKSYEHKASVFLPKIRPIEAWEFVADFSNMKYLNPTIEDFNIINESGNYEHWKYTIEYKEKLSHWPYSPNLSVANFDVKASSKDDRYLINSTHRTCMFAGLFCLDTKSSFSFSKLKDGAFCEEYISYQCPVFLNLFCNREVTYQRNAIMNNLHKKFIGRPL